MSHESDYENLTQAEIIAEMKSLMKVLEKKEKAQTKLVEKLEEKKVAAAPTKGVRPAQLDKNAKWVQYVHEYILSHGWEEFTHTERFGKGVADVDYPASELTPIDGGEAYVFEGSVTAANPNGEQPNLSHAMTLSKLYKQEKPELYKAFEAEYEPVELAEPAESASVKKSVIRVSMTLEEKLQQKALEKEMKEQEKAAKGKHCEDCGASHKNRKDNFCSPCRLKRAAAEKELAKVIAVKPKGAAKAILPKTVVRVIPKAPAVPKIVARPILAKPAWVPPPKGEMKRAVVSGIAYYMDHLNRAFAPNAEDMPGDLDGVYLPDQHVISKENIPEDE